MYATGGAVVPGPAVVVVVVLDGPPLATSYGMMVPPSSNAASVRIASIGYPFRHGGQVNREKPPGPH